MANCYKMKDKEVFIERYSFTVLEVLFYTCPKDPTGHATKLIYLP